MVRIIAEISVHSPTASSYERYKYQHGYQRGDGDGTAKEQQIIYKRPISSEHVKVDDTDKQAQLQKQSSVVDHNVGGGCGGGCGGGDVVTGGAVRQVTAMHEKQKEEELKKAKEKGIDSKLGRIIYRSRTSELFEAHHSIHMTVSFVYDKRTRQSTKTYTQKVVWNGRVFETKQDWFSEMARLSVVQTIGDNAEIVRCE